MASTSLTSSQEDFMAEAEKLYADRYSEKDEAFMKVKNSDPKKPPIIDPWHNKPRRPQNNWERHRHNRHNNWERHNERNDRYDRHAGRHHMYQRQHKPYY